MCAYVYCPWPLWPIGSLSGPSYLMGPRSGVPHLRGSGWGVSGVRWVSGFGGGVCVRGVRRFVCGGEGFGLLLAHPPGLLPVPLGLLEGGEEEGPSHLVEGGAARVFHPNGTVLPPVDSTDGAPLYPGGVGYVDDCPNDRILGTVIFLLGTLGGVGLGGGGGGGGFAVAVFGGLVGLGAGMAFVGRAVVVVGGGLGFLGRGIAPSSLSSDDLKENFRFLGRGGGGWDAAWLGGGGGVGAVVVDAPPPAYPTSRIRAHSLGRKWRNVHPDAAKHTRGLAVVETGEREQGPGVDPGP